MTSTQGRSGVDSLPDPPDAPDIPRRISFFRWQAIGMVVIAAIPLAALVGVFGDRWTPIASEVGALRVSGRAPSLMRYKTLNSITLHVSNSGTGTFDTVSASIDTGYIARFSTVSATPPFNGSYVTSIAPLRPRESALITIQLQGEQYGRHRGVLIVRAGSDTARIAISTIVLP